MKAPKPHERRGPSYSVAVYWLHEAEYGGANDARNWDDAMAQVERLRKLGYDKPGYSEIRIFRRVTDVWKAKDLTDCRAKLAAAEGEK